MAARVEREPIHGAGRAPAGFPSDRDPYAFRQAMR